MISVIVERPDSTIKISDDSKDNEASREVMLCDEDQTQPDLGGTNVVLFDNIFQILKFGFENRNGSSNLEQQ